MKRIYILIILLPFTLGIAQTLPLKGKVISDKAQPVIGANIILLGTNFGAAANEKGFFEISNIPLGDYTLVVSAIGYERRQIKYSLTPTSKPINIILRETVIETEQIIVSAGKHEQKKEDMAVSAVIIQPDYLLTKNFQTFDEMLRTIPGIQMNLEQVSIRGSSGYSKGVGARVLVAINGLPLYAGDNGDVVWEMIPLSDIERVEIIKGPASSLYGSSAIGGVINIITNTSGKIPVTHFRSYIGGYDNPSHDIWKWNDSYRLFYGTEITHSNSMNNLGYTFSLKRFDDMGYRQNDFNKKYLGYVNLNYKINEEDYFTFFTSYLNMNRGNFLYWKDSRNALVPKDEDNGNTIKSDRIFTGLIYHHHFNEKVQAEIKTSYYRTKFVGYGLSTTTSTANLARGEALINYKMTNSLMMTSGIEVSYSTVESDIFSNTNFFGTGAYAQFEYNIAKNLIATMGLRYDFIKIDTLSGKNAVMPRAGLNYKLYDNLILRASVGTGFRAPTPAEVFTSIGVGGGVDVKNNPDLTSETSLSFEAGFIYNPFDILSFDAAFYQTDYNNFIEANLTKDGDIMFINLPKARIQGFELTSNWHIIKDKLKISTGYNYMWARDIERNKSMKYRPQNTINLQVNYSPAPFEFGINFRHMSKVEEIDFALSEPPLALVIDGNERVPIYVTDLSAGYNFLVAGTPAKIYLNAKNIFNYNYVEFIGNLAPIRNYSISFDLYF